MTLDIDLLLAGYITERERTRTPDGLLFELQLAYQIEGSKEVAVFRWRWTYTDSQKMRDENLGIINARRARHFVEKRAFIRQVQRELKQRGERLYYLEGQQVPVRGKTIAPRAAGECG